MSATGCGDVDDVTSRGELSCGGGVACSHYKLEFTARRSKLGASAYAKNEICKMTKGSGEEHIV